MVVNSELVEHDGDPSSRHPPARIIKDYSLYISQRILEAKIGPFKNVQKLSPLYGTTNVL